MEFLIDNWWLILLVYGIWKAVTKKSSEAKRVAAVRDADIRRERFEQRARVEEDVDGNTYNEADADEEVVDVPRRTNLRAENDTRSYRFVDPVAAQEATDEKERVEAFQFEAAQRLTAPEVDEAVLQARRALQENLQRVYGIPTIAETEKARVSSLGITPDEIRRAIILTEILQPPRSRRPHR